MRIARFLGFQSADGNVDPSSRPFIELPRWDGKILLAGLFTIGYFWVIQLLVGPDRAELSETQKQIATIALAALGPQLGQIYGSIFRTTAADERSAARRDETLKTAIVTPGAPTGSAEELGDQVQTGAEKGARAGVADGLERAADERPATDEPEILS